MELDASTAYLPDNTWFVDGLFHGMTYKDNYTRVLMMTLLLTDNITDVYTDENYPQFKYSTNASHTVHARFDGCDEGILTGDAKNLVVTNVCNNSRVNIIAVYCDGAKLRFDIPAFNSLNPGEAIEIPFTGDIPEKSASVVNITVYYAMENVTPIGYRTQGFTLSNGAAVEKQDGFVDAETRTPFDDIIIFKEIDAIFRFLGIRELLSMFYTIIYCIATSF